MQDRLKKRAHDARNYTAVQCLRGSALLKRCRLLARLSPAKPANNGCDFINHIINILFGSKPPNTKTNATVR